MMGSHYLPPAPEDLAELFVALVRRLERLEGHVQQLRAQGTAAFMGVPGLVLFAEPCRRGGVSGLGFGTPFVSCWI